MRATIGACALALMIMVMAEPALACSDAGSGPSELRQCVTGNPEPLLCSAEECPSPSLCYAGECLCPPQTCSTSDAGPLRTSSSGACSVVRGQSLATLPAVAVLAALGLALHRRRRS